MLCFFIQDPPKKLLSLTHPLQDRIIDNNNTCRYPAWVVSAGNTSSIILTEYSSVLRGNCILFHCFRLKTHSMERFLKDANKMPFLLA